MTWSPHWKGRNRGRHHGHTFDGAAGGFHLDLLAVLDPPELGQFLADLHVGLRLGLGQPGLPAGDGARTPVLRAGVGGHDKGELRAAPGKQVAGTRKDLDDRTVELGREGVPGDGPFERFIVFRERAVGQTGPEKGGQTVRLHDEGVFAFLFIAHGRPGPVGDIAHPFPVFPGQQGPFGVIRLAVQVHGGAVIDDPSVDRPDPRPLGIEAESGGVIFLPPGHEVGPVLGEAAAGDPGAAGGPAIGLQQGKSGNQVPFLISLVPDGYVLQEVAVDGLGYFQGAETALLIGVVPVEVEDRFGKFPSLFSVEFF